MSGSIAHNINTIRAQLPPSVRLIAVTKQVSTAAMREAYAAGMRDFGESRIQEAEAKQRELEDLTDLHWHLIGHLQGNKVRKAVQMFEWIHSIDSLKIAQQIDRVAGELNMRPKVCLQVKILPDPQKHGWNIYELLADLPALDRCEHIEIRGLMAIAPLGLSDPEISELFCQVRDFAAQIKGQNWQRIGMTDLSMGMSGDYLLAIPAGATMIRLGSIIFGKRI
jgi:pyridoxal phosphate enzyme (YggS family)